jgi:hypothetical protein
MLILEWMEKKRDELEGLRSDLLDKEHDLLIRIMNEKALMDEERQEFERRKSADVLRLREEANRLESNLTQAENARNALLQSKQEYKRKIEQVKVWRVK